MKPPRPPVLPNNPAGFRIKTSKPGVRIGNSTISRETNGKGDLNAKGQLKAPFKKPTPVHYLAVRELIIQYFEDHPRIIKLKLDARKKAVLGIYKIILTTPQVRKLFSQIEEFELLAIHIRNTIENALGIIEDK